MWERKNKQIMSIARRYDYNVKEYKMRDLITKLGYKGYRVKKEKEETGKD